MFDTPEVNSFCENFFDLCEFPGGIKFEWNNKARPVHGRRPVSSNKHWGLHVSWFPRPWRLCVPAMPTLSSPSSEHRGQGVGIHTDSSFQEATKWEISGHSDRYTCHLNSSCVILKILGWNSRSRQASCTEMFAGVPCFTRLSNHWRTNVFIHFARVRWTNILQVMRMFNDVGKCLYDLKLNGKEKSMCANVNLILFQLGKICN